MSDTATIWQKVAIADPNDPSNVLIPSFQNGAAVTKSDSTILSPVAQALWVGGTGDVKVRLAKSQTDVTLTAVPAGVMLHLQIDKVYSTGTSATNMNTFW